MDHGRGPVVGRLIIEYMACCATAAEFISNSTASATRPIFTAGYSTSVAPVVARRLPCVRPPAGGISMGDVRDWRSRSVFRHQACERRTLLANVRRCGDLQKGERVADGGAAPGRCNVTYARARSVRRCGMTGSCHMYGPAVRRKAE